MLYRGTVNRIGIVIASNERFIYKCAKRFDRYGNIKVSCLDKAIKSKVIKK